MSAMMWIIVGILLARGIGALHTHFKARRSGLSRLAELQAGASEAWFEERRSLETFPSLAATPPLWHGLLAISLGLLMALWLLLR